MLTILIISKQETLAFAYLIIIALASERVNKTHENNKYYYGVF